MLAKTEHAKKGKIEAPNKCIQRKKIAAKVFFLCQRKMRQKKQRNAKKKPFYILKWAVCTFWVQEEGYFFLCRESKKKKNQTFIKRVRVAYGACMRCPKNINRRSRHSPSTIERNDCRMEKYILAVFVSASSNCLIEEAGDFFG